MILRINVTRTDLRRGRRLDPACCPVARALERVGRTAKVPGRAGWNSYAWATVGRVGVGRLMARPSPELVRFMLDFDDRLPVAPAAFDLDFPAAEAARGGDGRAGA